MFRPLALTACLLLAITAAQAQAPSPVQTAALSARLFDVAQAQADPVLMLAAARLRKQINPAEDAARQATGGEAGEGAPLTWQEMAAAAEALAEGDDTVLGLIEDLRAETTKGVVSGPVYNIGQIGAGRSDTYPRVDFKGGEYAEVYIEAKSSVDLNLTITDAQGRLVCADTDPSHIAYCGWRPDTTGAFTLRVDNRSGQSTRYALMTN